MTFLDLLFTEASGNGYTGTLTNLTNAAKSAMVGDTGCVTVMYDLFTHLSGHGYTKTAQQWEDAYWTGFGGRPNDR